MYFTTLNICACTLLLSSVATIIILLRKRFRRWKNTPLYVLSMSDVLFSMFTCTILFVNCMEHDTNTDVTAAANLKRSTTIECDVTNALMKYGTLFLPFTNSFVSLLMFSVQCNLNVFNLKGKCYESLRSEEKICDAREITSIERNTKKVLHAFKSGKMTRGVTAGFVLSQWIVPMFVTSLLYLANINESSTKEAAKCFTESVFFFDDCVNVEPVIIPQNSTTYQNPVYTEYINEGDLTSNKSNTTQLNEIVVKVQNLVYSLINETSTVSFDRISYNSSEAWDPERYFEVDAYTILAGQNKSAENESNPANSSQENPGNLIDLREDTNFTSDSGNYTDEHTFSNELTTNTSSYIVQTESNINEIATDKLDTSETETANIAVDDSMETTMKYEAAIMSSGQIYAEILKRIHNVASHHKYDKNKNYYNKKQPKELEGKYSEYSSALNDYVSLNINTTIYQQDNPSEVTLAHAACFISIRFLKVHLLLLVFVIYFLPILFSSILQQRGKSTCRVMLEKLEARNRSGERNSDFIYEFNDTSYEPGTSDLKSSSEGHRGSINFDKQQFGEDHDQLSDEHCKDNRTWNIDEIIDQMENTSKLFDTIRKSSLCGIILWTPLFLEFLIKVFVSLRVPEWLLNVTYLTATAFGTLRNYFNLRMIKYQEANGGVNKTNSVHPAK